MNRRAVSPALELAEQTARNVAKQVQPQAFGLCCNSDRTFWLPSLAKPM